MTAERTQYAGRIAPRHAHVEVGVLRQDGATGAIYEDGNNEANPKPSRAAMASLAITIPVAVAAAVAGGWALGKYVFAKSTFWPTFFGPAVGSVITIPVSVAAEAAFGASDAQSGATGGAASLAMLPVSFLASYAGVRLARR